MGILQHNGERFDIEIPVCVVGGGACGLTAAISAAQQGAQVAVFECDRTPAGSTAMSIGLICAAGTKSQAEAGVKDNPELLVQDIMVAARGQTDKNLVRFLAEESGPTIDWLCETGCDLKLEPNWPGFGHSVLRCHGTPNCSGEELIAMLLNCAKEQDVDIVTEATVTDLIVDGEENLIGLIFTSPDGAVRVGCQAIILASSGYGANEELVARHIPEMKDAIYHGCENHRGDAIRWGQALGAEMADLGSYQGVGTLTPYGFGLPHSIMVEGGVKVNRNGQRFENELENISRQARDVLAQPDGVAWIVYDKRIHDKTAEIFAEYGSNAHLISTACQAETISGLAHIIKVDPAGLAKTLDDVGQLIASGKLDEFGRSFENVPQLQPAFFAVKVTGALFHTQGGLCIDDRARVKRSDGTVFPNLFAGGGAVRSVSGPAEWGYLPAIGLSTAATFGRVAGREAAKIAV